MDSKHNTIPSSVNTIHLIAVCGTAMGALACMLKDLGYQVTGSDNAVYPPMSTFLEEKGIALFSGYDGAHLDEPPDLVVVGNAVGKDNPEARRMQDLDLFYCSMPQALNHFIARGKKPILITGTHGKTTTSSIAAWVLETAGLDPTFFVGGILRNFNSNYKLGKGGHIVIEGDEYDTAYFDKGPKFLHYIPAIAILTGIEFDHADIYRDIDHVTQSFEKLVNGMEKDSLLIASDDNEIVDRLADKAPCRVVRYGEKAKSLWRIGNCEIEPPFTYFEVMLDNALYGRFKTRMVGHHNLCNLLAVIAASHDLGIPASKIQQALDTFESVKRRQEVRGVKNGVTVMDDFAHHPTAVRETLRAVRPFYKGRIIAVFEPRTNTSMRDVFQDVYPDAFDEADIICIRKPPLLNKIPEGQRFSSEKLVEDLVGKGKDAHFFNDTEAILRFIGQTAREDDLVLVMSNGGFDGIHEKLLLEGLGKGDE
ncbi:MAG: UDP-N-acetylmuramate:L-alanyl-gamma-D-glutamyl-meso-diaminopimelate ligase [Desulfobacteraceae bacterium]|nr:UDP-N-acetylmuramate:L-alanyl-gamma-D-glutamyl-meso-diaminopimelate ligase [Desulfobacteraceae bacterium]